jgi:hypothetical protein
MFDINTLEYYTAYEVKFKRPQLLHFYRHIKDKTDEKHIVWKKETFEKTSTKHILVFFKNKWGSLCYKSPNMEYGYRLHTEQILNIKCMTPIDLAVVF